MTSRILVGDVRARLAELPAASVHCCVTSPPYYGLRDYGVAGQIGLEPTLAEYIAAMVDVFRGVRRVLRDDGTLFLNIGDSYAANRGSGASGMGPKQASNPGSLMGRLRVTDGLKEKDLMMVPARLAIALQQPYYTGVVKRPEDRAWLAAMIDSDGSLGIRIQKAREGRGTNETYIPYIAISQTDTGCLEHAARITGLGRVIVKQEPGTDIRGITSRRTMYSWRLDGQQASTVIRDIFPYLIVKKVQAQIVYAMNESLKWGRPSRSLPVPPDVMEVRRRLYAAIKSLNQRTPVDVPKLPEVPDAMEPGWYLRSDIIWHKKAPMPESVTDRPTSAHEHIFLLTKAARYFYDADAVREENSSPEQHEHNQKYAKPYAVYDERAGDSGQPGNVNSVGIHSRPGREGRNQRNVWLLGPEPFPEAHFATFPSELPRRCIKAGCPVGGTVLDPFLGSGTTLLVADQLGRDGIGIELNPTYAEMAERRIRGDAPLFADVERIA